MNNTLPRQSAGFTLVEMMVGVLIGLIGTVMIFQVFAVSEGQKRTTTGAGDAQQNGVFSLFQMERDLRMAGFGLNHTPLMGCPTNGWNEQTNQPIAFPLLPVVITKGVGNLPDSITVAYGDADLFSAPEKLGFTMASPTADFRVINRFGFRSGDVLVAAESGQPCTLAQASTLAGGTLDVAHASGTFTNPQGQVEATRFNRPGGLAPPNNIAYTIWKPATMTGGRLYNLGQRPVVVTYSIANDQLIATDRLRPNAPDAAVQLADGVVQLQAQYGFDENGDGRIAPGAASVGTINLANGAGDQWGDAMPVASAATDWVKVIAVRLVVVARSITPERADPALGVCNATVANPRWISAAVDVDITANPDWRCYRYRTFEVVVPLRNLVWFAQPS